MNKRITIEGLSCGHCVNAITNLLTETKGVVQASVSLPNIADVEFDDSEITFEELKQVVNDSEIYKAL